MNILIAEDDPVCQAVTEEIGRSLGHDVILADDGLAAWRAVEEHGNTLDLAVLDWQMPGLDGLEVCKRIRADASITFCYIIMFTSHGKTENIVSGFEAGADDYISKPFAIEEFRARIDVGTRMARLQRALEKRVAELERALADVKTLRELLPICSYCKKIRDDEHYWTDVDHYLMCHSDVDFTHGICPECIVKQVNPQLRALGMEELDEDSPEVKLADDAQG